MSKKINKRQVFIRCLDHTRLVLNDVYNIGLEPVFIGYLEHNRRPVVITMSRI